MHLSTHACIHVVYSQSGVELVSLKNFAVDVESNGLVLEGKQFNDTVSTSRDDKWFYD